jgi:hypothetical protein
MLSTMPKDLKNLMLENECAVPLPQYDTDGVFKSYLGGRGLQKLASPVTQGWDSSRGMS